MCVCVCGGGGGGGGGARSGSPFTPKKYLEFQAHQKSKDKDKDKEALFNVAYSVTDNISSWAILRHNNYIFNRYLPFFISLAQPLYASVSKGAASTIFYTFGMVRPRDSNPRPPAPKADALPTELSRR